MISTTGPKRVMNPSQVIPGQRLCKRFHAICISRIAGTKSERRRNEDWAAERFDIENWVFDRMDVESVIFKSDIITSGWEKSPRKENLIGISHTLNEGCVGIS
jgi:hypothetical protein